jgi:multicomponent Na+:H+ antiporter subunit F
MMLAVATVAILVTILLALLRGLLGPTVYDRILGLNMVATKIVLLIAVSGFLTGRPEFLDLGLLYALISFISLLAVLRFSKYGELGRDEGVES